LSPPCQFVEITDTNELTGWIHNGGSNSGRMPVILSEDDEMKWLQPNLTYHEIVALMQTYPAELMQGYAIKKDFLTKSPYDATILEPDTPDTQKITSLFENENVKIAPAQIYFKSKKRKNKGIRFEYARNSVLLR
jgi:hypothetical protein